MKKHGFLLLALAFALATSCTRKGGAQAETTAQGEESINTVHSLPEYEYCDSLTTGTHKTVYRISSRPDESLPVVVDEDSVKYVDNRFQLTVTRDGSTLFSRSFTRADFRDLLPGEFREYGIMDGLRFNRAEDGKLYFNACVSYPDSDMSCPFILTVGPDGSHAIEPDPAVDEEDEEFPSI